MEEQSTTDGSWWEIGFSCPAGSPKLSETEWTTPALSENPSLVIYTRGISVARYAVGEAPDAACLPRRPGLEDVCSMTRVPVWHDMMLSSGHAVPATPRFRVAGCRTHPIDNLFQQRMEGKPLLGIPRKDGELGLGIRQ